MKNNRIFSRVLCLVLCLMSLAIPVAATETEMPEVHNPAAAVRYGRNAGSLVIGYIEEGTQLQVLSDDYESVYKIDCYDMNGYISKANVRQEDGRYYVDCDMRDEQLRGFDPVTSEQLEQLQQALYETAESLLGVRYRWGGTTPKGFDCSGFIRYVFQNNGIELKRTSQDQLSDGIVIAKEDLQMGDLVYFTGTHGGAMVTHVGMYIGDNKMIHADNHGVSVDSLDSSYYSARYLCARRIVVTEKTDTDTYNFHTDSGVPAGRMLVQEQGREPAARNVVAISDKCDIIKLITLKDVTLE